MFMYLSLSLSIYIYIYTYVLDLCGPFRRIGWPKVRPRLGWDQECFNI